MLFLKNSHYAEKYFKQFSKTYEENLPHNVF